MFYQRDPKLGITIVKCRPFYITEKIILHFTVFEKENILLKHDIYVAIVTKYAK